MSEPLDSLVRGWQVGMPVRHRVDGRIGVIDHVYAIAVEVVWPMQKPHVPYTIEWKKDIECLNHLMD